MAGIKFVPQLSDLSPQQKQGLDYHPEQYCCCSPLYLDNYFALASNPHSGLIVDDQNIAGGSTLFTKFPRIVFRVPSAEDPYNCDLEFNSQVDANDSNEYALHGGEPLSETESNVGGVSLGQWKAKKHSEKQMENKDLDKIRISSRRDSQKKKDRETGPVLMAMGNSRPELSDDAGVLSPVEELPKIEGEQSQYHSRASNRLTCVAPKSNSQQSHHYERYSYISPTGDATLDLHDNVARAKLLGGRISSVPETCQRSAAIITNDSWPQVWTRQELSKDGQYQQDQDGLLESNSSCHLPVDRPTSLQHGGVNVKNDGDNSSHETNSAHRTNIYDCYREPSLVRSLESKGSVSSSNSPASVTHSNFLQDDCAKVFQKESGRQSGNREKLEKIFYNLIEDQQQLIDEMRERELTLRDKHDATEYDKHQLYALYEAFWSHAISNRHLMEQVVRKLSERIKESDNKKACSHLHSTRGEEARELPNPHTYKWSCHHSKEGSTYTTLPFNGNATNKDNSNSQYKPIVETSASNPSSVLTPEKPLVQSSDSSPVQKMHHYPFIDEEKVTESLLVQAKEKLNMNEKLMNEKLFLLSKASDDTKLGIIIDPRPSITYQGRLSSLVISSPVPEARPLSEESLEGPNRVSVLKQVDSLLSGSIQNASVQQTLSQNAALQRRQPDQNGLEPSALPVTQHQFPLEEASSSNYTTAIPEARPVTVEAILAPTIMAPSSTSTEKKLTDAESNSLAMTTILENHGSQSPSNSCSVDRGGDKSGKLLGRVFSRGVEGEGVDIDGTTLQTEAVFGPANSILPTFNRNSSNSVIKAEHVKLESNDELEKPKPRDKPALSVSRTSLYTVEPLRASLQTIRKEKVTLPRVRKHLEPPSTLNASTIHKGMANIQVAPYTVTKPHRTQPKGLTRLQIRPRSRYSYPQHLVAPAVIPPTEKARVGQTSGGQTYVSCQKTEGNQPLSQEPDKLHSFSGEHASDIVAIVNSKELAFKPHPARVTSKSTKFLPPPPRISGRRRHVAQRPVVPARTACFCCPGQWQLHEEYP